VDHALWHFLFRASSDEGVDVIPSDSRRPTPPPFIPGAERAAIFVGTNLIAYESSSASLFEEGIGQIASLPCVTGV